MSDEEFLGASSLPELLKFLQEIYKGNAATETVAVGLIAGDPILLIGPHGTFKTSIASFIGGLFEKEVCVLEERCSTFQEIEAFCERLANELSSSRAEKIDAESVMNNTIPHLDVEYSDYPGYTRVRATIDCHAYPINAERKFVPISTFKCQINDQLEPEDILGYGVQHRAVLGNKPPHVVKKGKLAGADYVVLDEAFAAPRLLSKLHTAVNEKFVDTTVGPVRIDPLTFVFCTNPWNTFYQTNPRIFNAATLDRFLASAEVLPPTGAQTLYTTKALRELTVVSKLRVETVLEARAALEAVTLPNDVMRTFVAITAILGNCYFSPTDGDIASEALNPFMIEKDCQSCRYNKSACAVANLGKVRALLSLTKVARAHAVLRGDKIVDEEDAAFALKSALPHRLVFNGDAVLEGLTKATSKLLDRLAEELAAYAPLVKDILKNGRDNEALKKKIADVPTLRAVLDDAYPVKPKWGKAEAAKLIDQFRRDEQ